MAETEADRAWVTVDVPLAPERLLGICRDLERLFRINPLLEFDHWRWLGPTHVQLAGRNLGNGRPFASEADLVWTGDGWQLTYRAGLKSATRLRVEPHGAGSRLTLEDDYSGTPPAERAARLEEVDRTLLPWGSALQAYLRSVRHWSWCPVWRWYVRRVWLPMKPSSRRIVGMLWWIGLAELVLFVGILALFLVPSG
jgi:hypothetical protein